MAAADIHFNIINFVFLSIIIMYHTENRAGPSNIGNVISQILLCKQIQPDFNQEEICSIAKDSQDLARLIQDMQEFLPQQDTAAGMYIIRYDNYVYYARYARTTITIYFLSLLFFAFYLNDKNKKNYGKYI